MRHTKTSALALAALGMGLAASAVHAQENNARIYGFLNLGVMGADDGFSTTTELVDNDNAPSRIGVWWENEVGQGTLRFNFETALGFRGSTSYDQTGTPDFFFWDRTKLRHVDVSYEGNFGKVYLGQGSMATDGIAGADFSGTDYIATRSIGDIAGGFKFNDGGTLGPSVYGVFSDFDGGRLGRFRYDTPNFNGFQARAAVGENILASGNDDLVYDLGLYYTGESGNLKYAARLGGEWVDYDGGGSANSVVLSAALLHEPTGINGVLAYGKLDDDKRTLTNSSDYIYTKVGVRRDWFDWGETRLSVDFTWANDSVETGDDGFSWGLAATQVVESINTELYLAYRNHQYNAPGANYSDVDAWMLAARWSF